MILEQLFFRKLKQNPQTLRWLKEIRGRAQAVWRTGVQYSSPKHRRDMSGLTFPQLHKWMAR